MKYTEKIRELFLEELNTFEDLKQQEKSFYTSDIEDAKYDMGLNRQIGLQLPITYTVNWSIITKDGEKIYNDNPNSRKSLERTRDRAEQVFKKFPKAKIWLTKWIDKNKVADNLVINDPSLQLSEDKIVNEQLKIDSGLLYSIKEKEVIEKFLEYIKRNLNIETMPKLHILDKRKDGMTYGMFDPTTEEISVYGKRRGLADVLRTSAHEYVHFKQKLEGRIPENLKHRDHALESEANTKAGDFVYIFGLEHPEIYEMGDGSEDIIEVPKN